ncbi:HNH endonuclease signature motif containing protein [Arthrobacter glacialis]|uniref:HNH nuclease domain-containing protein n=1 Tax=Arthrobacter glacialis TaxID=1664 RepID=A0A2S4A0R8_ARTGL|nr:HNH endonuclease signature motif containing protein [Arthrobacter glacialis]POH74964.1 hypothetical protein CVS27_03640 [Arthrobacter glacialis]
MEATARTPGNPGSTRSQRAVGQHIHQLLRLAAALADSPACSPAAPEGSTVEAPLHGTPLVEARLVEVPLGVDLAGLTDTQTISWGQSLEQLDHILSALQVQVAGELAARTRASRFSDAGFTKPVALLTSSLKLGAAEASRRLRLAEHFLPVTDVLTTVITPPTQPILGSAFFSGELSVEQALVVSGFADDARHLSAAGLIPEESAHDLETTLTNYAKDEPPDFLRRIGTRAVNLLDPDGQQPSDGELLAKQGIFFRHPRRGLVHFDGHLSVPQYETLMSAIGWATNPNTHGDINSVNTNTVDISTVDPLTDQAEAAGAAGGAASAPANGGGASSGSGADSGVGTASGADSGVGATSGSASGVGATSGSASGSAMTTGVQELPGQMELQGFISTMSAAFGGGQASPSNSWPPPQGPVPAWASGETASADGTPPESWPHLVNGIPVPEPGYEQDLPGLDPIDPNSTDSAVADRRSHGQKLLDGLIDCVKLAARTGKLPLNGGLKSQLFISTTEADLQRRTAAGGAGGIAFLPYGGPQPLELFKVELCDADVTTMVLGNGQDILNVGRTQRLFTAAQRKILLARDMGCTFPDCTAPACWCDAHHIIPWQDGGETSISNGTLLCSLHHQLVHRGHWTIEFHEGVPWYIPSFRLDPTQRARRNNYHHGLSRNGPSEPPEKAA